MNSMRPPFLIPRVWVQSYIIDHVAVDPNGTSPLDESFRARLTSVACRNGWSIIREPSIIQLGIHRAVHYCVFPNCAEPEFKPAQLEHHCC